MTNTGRIWRRGLLCALFSFLSQSFPANADLGQGWSDGEREWFYYATQGSQLIRRSWFLSLERHDSTDLFLADGLARFGYLPGDRGPQNQDQLPVGFAVDTPSSGEWVGMTCAACHTSEIKFGSATLRIDGAPAGADMYEFLAKLDLALQKAANDDAVFLRFAARVLGAQNNDANRKKLRDDLRKESVNFAKFVIQSTPAKARWGPARLDAFGMIFNRLTVIDLGIDGNNWAPDAPVSYPFLWGTSWHDFTQWNGAVENAKEYQRLARNIGQVLGVFGKIDFKKGWGYRSTVNKPNLRALEKQISKLKAPVWPATLFGNPEVARVERGERLYRDNCSGCHKLVRPEDQIKEVIVNVKLVPAAALGTDDTMARMAATRDAATGVLEGRAAGYVSGPLMKDREQATTILKHAVIGALIGGVQTADIPKKTPTDLLFNQSVAIGNYKARPLNGVWATAPYLHNGSVRTLWQLLLPPGQREPGFMAGTREFDPKEVGFRSAPAAWQGAAPFEFKTDVDGNRNTGHVYGTKMSEEDRRDLVEYMKTL